MPNVSAVQLFTYNLIEAELSPSTCSWKNVMFSIKLQYVNNVTSLIVLTWILWQNSLLYTPPNTYYTIYFSSSHWLKFQTMNGACRWVELIISEKNIWQQFFNLPFYTYNAIDQMVFMNQQGRDNALVIHRS